MTEYTDWLIDYFQSHISGLDVTGIVFFLWSLLWLTGFGVGFLGAFISRLFYESR